jgi:hypothetical protein
MLRQYFRRRRAQSPLRAVSDDGIANLSARREPDPDL